MDFTRNVNEDLASDLRGFLDENYSEGMRARRFDWPFDEEFNKRFLAWQQEHLVDSGPEEINAFLSEIDRANIDMRPAATTILVATILASVGTDYQKEVVVPKLQNGEIRVSLGYTEPDSGSDVAAAKTVAVRDGDEWVINGQKMYTSNADINTHVLLLTRTNREVPKHEGLTMFLVPLDSPGAEVRPIQTLRGHPTFMTYYGDVRLPDSARVGEVDGGWSVMRVALDVEHSAGGQIDLMRSISKAMEAVQNETDKVLRRAVEWARATRREDGTRVIDDPDTRVRLAQLSTECEIARLLGARNDPEASAPGVGNGRKLFSSELYVRAASELMDIAGPLGLIRHGETETQADGWFEYAFRDSPVSTIAGGCSEVQRDVIAERRLGLPRSRPRS